jgi:hypothetical protein
MKLPYLGIHWLLSIAMMAALVNGSCNWTSALKEGQKSLTALHVAGTPLRVETANGSISVSKADREDVQIVAKISAATDERLAAAKIVATRFGDNTLMISCDWPDGNPQDREACSFEVQIPDAVGVALVAENGNLQVSDLAGSANLQTTNGNLSVERQAGPVVAGTTNGKVTVSAASGSVKANAANGAINIELAPGSVGPIQADGVNAMIDLAIGPSFAGRLSLGVTNGMVTVDPLVKADVMNGEAHKMQLAFGTSEQRSFATTVNGMVHVRQLATADEARQ